MNFFFPFSACGAFYAKAGVCYMVDTDPDKVYKNASLLNINADVNYFIRIWYCDDELLEKLSNKMPVTADTA